MVCVFDCCMFVCFVVCVVFLCFLSFLFVCLCCCVLCVLFVCVVVCFVCCLFVLFVCVVVCVLERLVVCRLFFLVGWCLFVCACNFHKCVWIWCLRMLLVFGQHIVYCWYDSSKSIFYALCCCHI